MKGAFLWIMNPINFLIINLIGILFLVFRICIKKGIVFTVGAVGDFYIIFSRFIHEYTVIYRKRTKNTEEKP
ncbi:hypothetical protein FACS1894172_18210 [Spirochaetia bacterium]|nr:hypothetical protein FACS1894164_13170 [Spirochaetia bacterium]GHU35878.1 hypothetical protein FACS1894172_18210 [Spirochaetia bacterium]